MRSWRAPKAWPSRRLRTGWGGVGALLLIGVALGGVNSLSPTPGFSGRALLPAADPVRGTAPTLPGPGSGSGAVGVWGLGLTASAGKEEAIPAASVTKV